MKILLVDDDPVLADSLADELTGFGHALSTASDGRAALAAIDQDAFDAVVLKTGWQGRGVIGCSSGCVAMRDRCPSSC